MRVTVQPEDPASVTGNTDKNCVCEIDRSKELRVFFFSWVLISFQICFKALFSLLAVLKQLYKGWKRFLTVYPWRFSFLQVTTGSMWKINRKKELRLCPFSHYRTPGRSWRVNNRDTGWRIQCAALKRIEVFKLALRCDSTVSHGLSCELLWSLLMVVLRLDPIFPYGISYFGLF